MSTFPGKGMLDGLAVTARNFVGSYFDEGRKERLFTIQYPEERMPLPENSRTFPFLVCDDEKKAVDTIRCTACKICETECPPQCIYIVMDRDEKGKPRQRPKVFDIDYSVCMQCQICVEVCPFDAIKMDNEYEHSKYERFDQLVMRLPDLLKGNDYYRQVKPTEAGAVDAKRKADLEKKAKKSAAPAAKPAPAPVPAPAAATAPKPAPAPAIATLKIRLPDDAPFNQEQRAWIQGFLSGISLGGAPMTASAPAAAPAPSPVSSPAAPATPAPAAAAVSETAAAPAAPATGDWPWHDAGLNMQQRLDLAKDKPLPDKLMAAMAQTDCHACGYDCRGYADAIATGAEGDLSLCLPGEAETAAMLEKLKNEAGKP